MDILLIALFWILIFIFAHMFLVRLQNRGSSTGRHRNPNNIRRGFTEPPELSTTGGIPIATQSTTFYLTQDITTEG